MARKTERVTIGGSQYQITQLGAVEGRELRKRFIAAIGPLLREAISGPMIAELQRVLTGELELQAAVIAFAPLLIKAYETVPTDVYKALCDAFAACTTTQVGTVPNMSLGNREVYDQHFAGDYMNHDAWFAQCIKVNGFLVKMGALSAPAEPTP